MDDLAVDDHARGGHDAVAHDVAQFLDLLDRMHHCRMVAPAEFTANLGQRSRGQLLGEKHRDLAWPGHLAGPPWRLHIGKLDVEMLGHAALDVLDGAFEKQCITDLDDQIVQLPADVLVAPVHRQRIDAIPPP